MARATGRWWHSRAKCLEEADRGTRNLGTGILDIVLWVCSLMVAASGTLTGAAVGAGVLALKAR